MLCAFDVFRVLHIDFYYLCYQHECDCVFIARVFSKKKNVLFLKYIKYIIILAMANFCKTDTTVLELDNHKTFAGIGFHTKA